MFSANAESAAAVYPEKTVFAVYHDDSNTFTTGRKADARTIPNDPRWRYDFGRILRTATGRPEIPGRDTITVYISQNHDEGGTRNTMIDYLAKTGADVRSFYRAMGREKEVDTSIVADIVEHASRLYFEAKTGLEGAKERLANTVFVVFSGDLDIRPAVAVVLKYGMRVHMCSFRESMSVFYMRMAAELPDQVKMSILDNRICEFAFFRYQCTNIAFDSSRALVVSIAKNLSDEERRHAINVICGKLLRTKELFFVWPDTGTDTRGEVVFLFPRSHINVVVAAAARITGLPVRKYWDESKTPTAAKRPDTIYASLAVSDDEESFYSAEAGSRDSSDASCDEDASLPGDGFELVERKRQSAIEFEARLRHKNSMCPRRIHCGHAASCTMRHTDEEMALFKKLPKIDFRFWKVKKCANPNKHYQSSCPYAHDATDSWCLNCRCFVHLTEKCPFA